MVAKELVRGLRRGTPDEIRADDAPSRGPKHHVKRVLQTQVRQRARHTRRHAPSQPTAFDREGDPVTVMTRAWQTFSQVSAPA